MPFTLPRTELLDQNVLSTIKGLTTGNGFQITLNGVQLDDPDNPEIPADLLAVIAPGDDLHYPDSDTPEDQTPIGAIAWYRPYDIIIYLLKSQIKPDLSFRTWANIVRAEVEKCMLADRGRGTDTNGVTVAQDTYCRGVITFGPPDDARGIIVRFQVRYWTNDEDPYNPH